MTNPLAIFDRPKFQFNAHGRITSAAFGFIPAGQKDHCLNRPRRIFTKEQSMYLRRAEQEGIAIADAVIPEFAPQRLCTIGRKA